ncbi:hypothetical protein BSF38_05746 [Paludisphaera borealis]|uniref:Uncharacterized protein n=1 Tax=Paludisphaera borealis TaxID=1387353 RepID=A0A1U7CYY7_9BACT|nr:hypothetical protein BSF38_05746 [Paludisphaera borealis]
MPHFHEAGSPHGLMMVCVPIQVGTLWKCPTLSMEVSDALDRGESDYRALSVQ